jgi:hypothetical protein
MSVVQIVKHVKIQQLVLYVLMDTFLLMEHVLLVQIIVNLVLHLIM